MLMSVMILAGQNLSIAQSDNGTDKFEEYFKQLDLSDSQKSEFKKIVKKYDSELAALSKKGKSAEVKNEFNRAIKNETSEMYHALPIEQFRKYKVLKKKIEPQKLVHQQ